MLFHSFSCMFDLMQLRLLLSAAHRAPPRRVLVAIDDLGAATVGDVLAALGVPTAGACVDGHLANPADAALGVLVDGATIEESSGGSDPSALAIAGVAVVAGPDGGRVIALGAGTHVIGRDPASVVPIADRTVSRRHCEIRVSGDAAAVIDLGSVNGSRIDETWLVVPSPVAPEVLVHVGASSLRVH